MCTLVHLHTCISCRVVGNRPVVEGRPGSSLPATNLEDLRARLVERWEGQVISQQDVLSAALYPKVFDEYKCGLLLYSLLPTDLVHRTFAVTYSHLTEQLPTRAFFTALDIDEEIDVHIAQGVVLAIKLKAVGELQPNGVREVFFETNGIPRVVDVVDSGVAKALGRAARDKADPDTLGSIGAPMAGQVVEVLAKPGVFVSAGAPLVVLSAMEWRRRWGRRCQGRCSTWRWSRMTRSTQGTCWSASTRRQVAWSRLTRAPAAG